jgi:hypothetical protein
MFAPITKVNEGESNTPCPSILELLGLKNYLKPCVELMKSVVYNSLRTKISQDVF